MELPIYNYLEGCETFYYTQPFFQVMKVRVDLICYLAQNGVFTNTTAEFILADLVEKVGDVKNGAGCQEALSCIAEATSLEFASSQVFRTTHSGRI